MILDSFWKSELKGLLKKIRRWNKLTVYFTDYAERQVSKYILYSAVIIRKMFEDEKDAETALKNSKMPKPNLKLLNYSIPILEYSFIGDESFVPKQLIPENYDYNSCMQTSMPLNYVCNQILHSYIWAPIHFEHSIQLFGVAFASDDYKTESIFLLQPKDWEDVIQFCIENGHIN